MDGKLTKISAFNVRARITIVDKQVQITVTLLGVFFLGCFFGFLTSLAVDFASNVKLKVISAFIGAALAGALVLFMRGLTLEKWMYPIGLVIGFLWVRIVRARDSESPYSAKLAWVDTILIFIFTVVVFFCATLATSDLW